MRIDLLEKWLKMNPYGYCDGMNHFGDVSRISGYDVPPVDVLVGGSPCQDLSVAGNRAGLDGERSGLFMQQVRITKEMRERDVRSGIPNNLARPRYLVWENVPGAFSSNEGKDFQTVLTEIIRIAEPEAPAVPVPADGWPNAGCLSDVDGRWSLAWRVHDAQFWGVAQRRRRISVVADFGGCSAGDILFERRGLHGDIAASGAARQGTAADAERGAYPSGIDGYNGSLTGGVSSTLGVNCGMATGRNGVLNSVAADTPGGIGAAGFNYLMGAKAHDIGYADEQAPTCRSAAPDAVVLFEPKSAFEENWAESDVKNALRAEASKSSHAIVFDAREPTTYPGVGITSKQNASKGTPGVCHTLNQDNRNYVVAGFCKGASPAAQTIGYQEEVSPTIKGAPSGTAQVPAVFDARGNGDGSTTPTLTGDHQNRVPDYTGIVAQPVCFEPKYWKSNSDGVAETQMATQYKDPLIIAAVDCRNLNETGETFGTLQAKPNGGQSLNYSGAVRSAQSVRRLTPLECERLQGYPDGWTDIPPMETVTAEELAFWRPVWDTWCDIQSIAHKTDKQIEKWLMASASDGPRYKALGNSIALPFWAWLCKRISAQYARSATMGSLFDGIGGFPLVWERVNGRGSCLWASEIEPFPIRVTRHRFNEHTPPA